MVSSREWQEKILTQPKEYEPMLIDVLRWLQECRNSGEYDAQAFAAGVDYTLNFIPEITREYRLIVMASLIKILVRATVDDELRVGDYPGLYDALLGPMIE